MLFNNCHRRPHAELFGPSAFFDLMTVGKQKEMATDLQPGQHCCVAIPTEDGDIEFAWYCFSHERPERDPNSRGTIVRVFYGERLGSVTLPRAEAIETQPYSNFFNISGHFKQWSAIRPRGDFAAPAGLRRRASNDRSPRGVVRSGARRQRQ